jgi:hypothetical protein
MCAPSRNKERFRYGQSEVSRQARRNGFHCEIFFALIAEPGKLYNHLHYGCVVSSAPNEKRRRTAAFHWTHVFDGRHPRKHRQTSAVIMLPIYRPLLVQALSPLPP